MRKHDFYPYSSINQILPRYVFSFFRNAEYSFTTSCVSLISRNLSGIQSSHLRISLVPNILHTNGRDSYTVHFPSTRCEQTLLYSYPPIAASSSAENCIIFLQHSKQPSLQCETGIFAYIFFSSSFILHAPIESDF